MVGCQKGHDTFLHRKIFHHDFFDNPEKFRRGKEIYKKS